MEVISLLDIPTKGLDLILLDLDNTLYDYKSCHNNALQKLAEEFQKCFNISSTEVTALYQNSRKIVHDRHLGKAQSHSRLFYIQEMVEKISGRTNADLITKLTNTYWESYISRMELFEDAAPFLKGCSSQNVPVIMVTDMLSEIQFSKIKKLDIGNYFQFIVTSEEAGLEKPHPYIFELAITKSLLHNPTIKNIAVIGDNIKKDIYTSAVYSIQIFHVIR